MICKTMEHPTNVLKFNRDKKARKIKIVQNHYTSISYKLQPIVVDSLNNVQRI